MTRGVFKNICLTDSSLVLFSFSSLRCCSGWVVHWMATASTSVPLTMAGNYIQFVVIAIEQTTKKKFQFGRLTVLKSTINIFWWISATHGHSIVSRVVVLSPRGGSSLLFSPIESNRIFSPLLFLLLEPPQREFVINLLPINERLENGNQVHQGGRREGGRSPEKL